MSAANMSMDEAKELGLHAAGRTFINPKGAAGTVLDHLDERGYVQARFNCTEAGCQDEHIRASSDWHEVGKCRLHAGKRGDGSRPRLKKILPGDDAETVALKEELNRTIVERRANAAAQRREASAKARLRREIAAMHAAPTSAKVQAEPPAHSIEGEEVGNG